MPTKILAFAAALLFGTAVWAQSGAPEVTNAWARATPGKAENGAAYLTIRSPTADRLVSVSSPIAKKAELHTMSMSGTVMQMRPVAGIDIPAGQPVTLKPGGEHVMLQGLEHPLQEGQSFPLTLSFEKGGVRTVSVPIERAGAAGPAATAKH